ncbi:hypothetical protein CEXT_101261, partial [Caerostris extrusa]
ITYCCQRPSCSPHQQPPTPDPSPPVVNHVAPAACYCSTPWPFAPALAYGGINCPSFSLWWYRCTSFLHGGLAGPRNCCRAIAAPVACGGVIGHGAALGLGYGAGILGAGIGKY